jgi:carboxylesterase
MTEYREAWTSRESQSRASQDSARLAGFDLAGLDLTGSDLAGPAVAGSYVSAFTPPSEEAAAQLLPDALPRLRLPALSSEEATPSNAFSNTCSGTVILCLHGFSGLPYEIYPALDAIAQSGMAAACPLLPRHGYRDAATQHREFALLNPDELLEAVRQEIALARQQYRQVGLMGFSMGGAIALALAAEGLVDACVALAPALRLPLKAEILIPLLGWADFEVSAPPKESFYFPKYEFHPARSLGTLWRIAALARRRLRQIRCPLQVIHSRRDGTIPPRVVSLIERRVPGPVETAWFNQSGHIMLRDRQGEAVAEAIAQFFQRQLCPEVHWPSPGPGSSGLGRSQNPG